MSKRTRNIILAVVILVILVASPFWPTLRQAFSSQEEDTQQASGISCTVTVVCQDQTLLPTLQEEGISVEEDGTLFSASVSVAEGATILDALEDAARQANAAVVTEGSPAYVTTIGGLAAGAHGDMSGWTYTVDGEMIMESCDVQTVQEGDEILWAYVTSWE